MDGAAVTLKLRTSDGQKLKLTMMRATVPSPHWVAARPSGRAWRRWASGSRRRRPGMKSRT